MNYKHKYLKYKHKYLELLGGRALRYVDEEEDFEDDVFEEDDVEDDFDDGIDFMDERKQILQEITDILHREDREKMRLGYPDLQDPSYEIEVLAFENKTTNDIVVYKFKWQEIYNAVRAGDLPEIWHNHFGISDPILDVDDSMKDEYSMIWPKEFWALDHASRIYEDNDEGIEWWCEGVITAENRYDFDKLFRDLLQNCNLKAFEDSGW